MTRLSQLAALLALTAGAGCPTGDLVTDDDDDDSNGVTVHDPERAWAGYTLYSGRWTEEAHLLDMDGQIVHSWSLPQGFDWCYAELQPDGSLAVIIKELEEQVEGMFFELSWDGELLRRIDVPVHHDFVRKDDGNTVLLCREYVSDDEIHPGGLKSDYLVELTPDDEPVWEWHAHEHALKLQTLVDVDFPRADRDWAHTNTVERLPAGPAADADPRFAEGNLLFSMCNMDTIGVIDAGSGEVVWAWGPGVVQKQHMPTMLDNGHLLIFDNGSERGWSRILELDPVTEEVVWSYVADPAASFFSDIRGASQRLPNGNTLITDSDHGRIFEVTIDGDIVWEWTTPDRFADTDEVMPIYRSMRYAPGEIEPRL
jgi:hypothetical protein